MKTSRVYVVVIGFLAALSVADATIRTVTSPGQSLSTSFLSSTNQIRRVPGRLHRTACSTPTSRKQRELASVRSASVSLSAPIAIQEVLSPDHHQATVQTAEPVPAWPEAKLALSDGSEFRGFSIGADRSIAGEVVFSTGMTGYTETLTDPSYKGQILVFTYPLIGNYGVPDEYEIDEFGLSKHFESNQIHVAGVVIADYSDEHSHWNGQYSLSRWLKQHNVPCISGIDTRHITKKIRDHGAMLGKIIVDGDDIPFHDPNQRNLIAEVSRKHPEILGNGSKKIIAVDFGIKNNIIRELLKRDLTVKAVPWDYDYTNEEFDGVFLSNGPGNPESAIDAIHHLRTVIDKDIPIFGICMGHQVITLAAGAKTYKMKFGNRGFNQPVVDLRTSRTYITSQNHGYACDEETLPQGYLPLFRNLNDNSNEGIMHQTKPIFSAQFHPEGYPGPEDTSFLFDLFVDMINKKTRSAYIKSDEKNSDRATGIKKVLLLGSGGLSIGQAGEFDYSGSQAIKALKELDVEVILVNPNIATIQTSQGMADKTYFHPITLESISEIIKTERPDSVLLQFGGQTALNIGVQLYDAGVLDEYNVRVLGTSVESIRSSEDRELFAQKMAEIGEQVAPSMTANSVEGALAIADQLGYPVLVRTAFALGGLGSGFANDPEQLLSIVNQALSGKDNAQIIIDKSLKGWKEIEYEIVRDEFDNCIAVCNMENFDPLGIHTGESIVVAPSQTLTNSEYYKLRNAALRIARHMKVVGECNVQYALDPDSERYYIIEMNARLSRSSALASKATGYPLAYVAAKLATGCRLDDVKNSVTKETTACFEPSLDYVVVKFPRWDLDKFQGVKQEIGSSMKSVGEVMAIGRSFEEAFQKGLRMVGMNGFTDGDRVIAASELESQLMNPTPKRVLHLATAFRRGYTIDDLFALTQIDRFFLYKLRTIANIERQLQSTAWSNVPLALITEAKQAGFSDKQIGDCMGIDELHVRSYRIEKGIVPYVKQIDTLAAEFPSRTNYLYMTYNADQHDVTFDTNGIMVMGCGSYRIGSSCEFDWSAVSCLRTLSSLNKPSILVNFNPETVSTDYDECDRLYFEELSLERILDIYQTEMSSGVIISVGGQIPNNLAIPLHNQGVQILGTNPTNIDRAEDRSKFSQLLDSLSVNQPAWRRLNAIDETLDFADQIGYPVLIRPSYVLSGAAMNVAYNCNQLTSFLELAGSICPENAVVVSKFVDNAMEIELDGVAKDGLLLTHALSEHVENAGVHSGDATLLLPAQSIDSEAQAKIVQIAQAVAKELSITGPFNMQFLQKNGDIQVIECNLRASRSFPFASKTYGLNFIDIATRAIIGADIDPIPERSLAYVACKAPMFSFSRLPGADPALGVEMASTGEVACFGRDKYEAFLKAMISTGFRIPKQTILLSVPSDHIPDLIQSARIMAQLGYKLYATPETVSALSESGVFCNQVDVDDAMKAIHSNAYDLVVNVPSGLGDYTDADGYRMRRAVIDFKGQLLTNLKLFKMLALALQKSTSIAVSSWSLYMDQLQ